MPIKLPRVGTGIVLRDLREAAYQSRIESWDRQVITVVKPVGVPAAFPYPPGTPFDVLWTAPEGQHVLPVELVDSRSEGAVLLWELQPVTQPWVEQRREFVRVPAFGRVTLRADLGAEFGLVVVPADSVVRQGYLIDVSEAALQCSVWAEPDDPLLAEASRVTADFSAHGTPFTRTGVVYGARPGVENNEMTMIVSFDQTNAEAKDLRREVFAAQVDLRHTWQRARQALTEDS
ncbi:MAG: hypothetical protein ABI382_12365 [Nakamurella sp.]